MQRLSSHDRWTSLETLRSSRSLTKASLFPSASNSTIFGRVHPFLFRISSMKLTSRYPRSYMYSFVDKRNKQTKAERKGLMLVNLVTHIYVIPIGRGFPETHHTTGTSLLQSPFLFHSKGPQWMWGLFITATISWREGDVLSNTHSCKEFQLHRYQAGKERQMSGIPRRKLILKKGSSTSRNNEFHE